MNKSLFGFLLISIILINETLAQCGSSGCSSIRCDGSCAPCSTSLDACDNAALCAWDYSQEGCSAEDSDSDGGEWQNSPTCCTDSTPSPTTLSPTPSPTCPNNDGEDDPCYGLSQECCEEVPSICWYSTSGICSQGHVNSCCKPITEEPTDVPTSDPTTGSPTTSDPTPAPTCPDYSGNDNPCEFYEQDCCPTASGLCTWRDTDECNGEGGRDCCRVSTDSPTTAEPTLAPSLAPTTAPSPSPTTELPTTANPTPSPTCPDYSGNANPCEFYEVDCCPTDEGLCTWTDSDLCNLEGGRDCCKLVTDAPTDVPSDDPTSAQPTTEAPTTEDPTTADPTTAEPTTPEPTPVSGTPTEDPTTAEPTDRPTTETPTTPSPTTPSPTTPEPTTPAPTTPEPTTPAPTTPEPTTPAPTTPEPTTPAPTTPEPTTPAPTTPEPTTPAPTTPSPTTPEPTTPAPTTPEPTTPAPTTPEPTTPAPTTPEPTTPAPTTPSPTTPEPTTPAPTTPSPTRRVTPEPTTPAPTTPSPTRKVTPSPTTPSPTRKVTPSPTTPSPTRKVTDEPTKKEETPEPTRGKWPTPSYTVPTKRPTMKSAMKWEMIHPAYKGNDGELLWHVYYGDFSNDDRFDQFREKEMWDATIIKPVIESDLKFKKYQSRKQNEAVLADDKDKTSTSRSSSHAGGWVILFCLIIIGLFAYWYKYKRGDSKLFGFGNNEAQGLLNNSDNVNYDNYQPVH